jgi:16S rRNA (cytosine967-C5)-methyltransferase
VYATCSLLRDENDAQVARFLAEHPEFARVEPGPVLVRAGVPTGDLDCRDGALHLDPLHPAHPDGVFAAALVRA